MNRVNLWLRKTYYRLKFGPDDGRIKFAEDFQVEIERQRLLAAKAELISGGRESAVQVITHKNRLAWMEDNLKRKLVELSEELRLEPLNQQLTGASRIRELEDSISNIHAKLNEISPQRIQAEEAVENMKLDVLRQETKLNGEIKAFVDKHGPLE